MAIQLQKAKFCPNGECGKFNPFPTPGLPRPPEDAAFCPVCGTALEERDERLKVNIISEGGVQSTVLIDELFDFFRAKLAETP